MTRLRLASGILLLLGGIVPLVSFGGCSGIPDDGTFPAGGTNSGNGGAGSGAQSTGADTSMGVFSSTVTGTSTMSGTTMSGGGGNCGGQEYTGQKLPLAMFIMLDKSGSMNDSTGAGTKWQAVTTALQAYINAPTSAGVEVGISFFGIPPGGGPACPTACGAQCTACGGQCLLGIQCLAAGGNS